MSTEPITLEAAQEARQIAESKLAIKRAETEALALERTHALLEAPQPVAVPWQEYPQFDGFGSLGSWERPFLFTDRQDRIDGKYLPLYETELDLRKQRADARRLHAFFPVAQNAIKSLCNYTIGNGFGFEVRPKEAYKQSPQALAIVPVVQAAIDRLLDRNDFVGDLDRTIHNESRIDGETFVAIYPDGQDVRIELVAPDCVVQPLQSKELERFLKCGHKYNQWWHGVHTQFNHQMRRDDAMRPLGYHCVFDKTGEMWDYLPALRVEHIKRNVGRDAHRGVTDFLSVLSDFENEAKIRRNTAVGAAILAAIVLIRQHAEGASRSSVESMVSANATSSYQRTSASGATRTSYSEHTVPGTVKDMPHGMQAMLGPMGSLNSPIYIDVAQYLLRIIATRWNMPESIISSDASNNNLASALVAHDPFVKAMEHEQAVYAGHFESLIWKALMMSSQTGGLSVPFKQACELLDIRAEYSSPASRDKKEQAETNKILQDAGILSDRTFAADMGFDLDEELANGAAKKPAPVMPFGGWLGGPPRMEGHAPSLAELAVLIESRKHHA